MKLIFFVSKKWQVENFKILIKELKKTNQISFGFVCLDNYSKGNSHKSLKNVKKFKIPKNDNKFPFGIFGRYTITKALSNFIENIKDNEKENKTILILDSSIGDGQMYARDLKLYANYKIFLLQHGVMDYEQSYYHPFTGWQKSLDSNFRIKWFLYTSVIIFFYQIITLKIFNLKNYVYLKNINWNKFNQINLLPFSDRLFVYTKHDKYYLYKKGCKKKNIIVSGKLFYFFNKKNYYDYKNNKENKLLIIYTSGDSESYNSQIFIEEVINFAKKNKFKILFKIKNRETGYFKKYYSKYNFNDDLFKNNLVNNYVFVPTDSHLNIELSSLKTKYFVFNTYNTSNNKIKKAVMKEKIPIVFDCKKSSYLNKNFINKILKQNYKGNYLRKKTIDKLVGNVENKIIQHINKAINEKL